MLIDHHCVHSRERAQEPFDIRPTVNGSRWPCSCLPLLWKRIKNTQKARKVALCWYPACAGPSPLESVCEEEERGRQAPLPWTPALCSLGGILGGWGQWNSVSQAAKAWQHSSNYLSCLHFVYFLDCYMIIQIICLSWFIPYPFNFLRKERTKRNLISKERNLKYFQGLLSYRLRTRKRASSPVYNYKPQLLQK